MKKIYMISLLTACMIGMSAQAQTLPRPTVPVAAPVDGGTYVLVNIYSPQRHYSNLTWWDNAVYLTEDIDFELTAVDNGDGTWSFTRVEGESTYYMITRYNDGNVRWNSEEQTKWYVEAGDFDGFVRLKAGEGNGDPQQQYYVHLNANADYMIVSCPGYPFYPDFAGGRVLNPDEEADDEYLIDETGRYVMADHTSENWGFIAKADVPTFQLFYQAYKALTDLQQAAIDLTEYEDGFNATLTAALTQYNNGVITETDAQDIIDMIEAKNLLYARLEEAYYMEADAKLTAAIQAAQDAFDQKTSKTDVLAALDALNEAIFEFESGTGDYTGLIQNPSFEDLSSQGGSQTSVVAAPPTGWNVYVKGVQVTTADQVRNAGIQNWHGINNDCDGEAKDGNYGFGLWTGAVPAYEISQTIEGLECGTYIVSAGVMVGANGSGSRRTTQRLFGNYNTAYFGHPYEYDATLLDLGEVREFAELDEMVTDRTLQAMSVRAYVYDGKLTFGLRTDGNIAAALRETNNGAGGDGWFKLDNFHIQKEGYIGSEAANVANTFLQLFKSYQGDYMYKELTTQIQSLVQLYTEKTAESPKEEINAMIISLNEQLGLIDQVKSSVAAYERLMDAIEDGYLQLEEYQFNKGADEYEEMLETAESGYLQGDYTNEDIDSIIVALNEKLDEVIKAGVAVGEYINVIKNPSFEDMSAQGNAQSEGPANPPAGWTLKLNGTTVTASSEYGAAGANLNWCAINDGDDISATDELGGFWNHQYTDGKYLWGIWADNMPDVELSQTIEGLPAGTYVLSCDMVVPNDWSGYSITTQRIFANHYVQMFSNENHYSELNETEDMKMAKAKDAFDPEATIKCMNYAGWQSNEADGYDDDAKDVASTLCPYPMSLTFGVGEDGLAYIGFRTNNVFADGTSRKRPADGWFKLDNFKLFYESTDIPTAISTQEIASAATQVVSRKYYTPDGAEVAQPQRGITIVRNVMSDGSIKSVKMMK